MKKIDLKGEVDLIESLFSSIDQNVIISKEPIKVKHKTLKDDTKTRNRIIAGLVSMIERIIRKNNIVNCDDYFSKIKGLLREEIEYEDSFYDTHKYYGFKNNKFKIKNYIKKDGVPKFCIQGSYKVQNNELKFFINTIANMEECHRFKC